MCTCPFQGNVITRLGSISSPWQLTATLKKGAGSDARAVLVGNTSVDYFWGWANFTDLGISHSGSDYTIEIAITRPAEASKYTKLTSTSLIIAARKLTAVVVGMPTSSVIVDRPFSLDVEIRDQDTMKRAYDIGWKVRHVLYYLIHNT